MVSESSRQYFSEKTGKPLNLIMNRKPRGKVISSVKIGTKNRSPVQVNQNLPFY